MELDQATMMTLLAMVVGGVVVPIVGAIKKTVVVTYIKPEFLTFILAAAAAYPLMLWLQPGTELVEILKQTLAAVGTTSITYGTYKAVKK